VKVYGGLVKPNDDLHLIANTCSAAIIPAEGNVIKTIRQLSAVSFQLSAFHYTIQPLLDRQKLTADG
jgi:hypothetical protein